MNKIWLVIFIPFFVTGCAATLVSSNPKEVIVTNVSKSTAGDALRLADSECGKYNKHAFYMPDDNLNGMARYRCIN